MLYERLLPLSQAVCVWDLWRDSALTDKRTFWKVVLREAELRDQG